MSNEFYNPSGSPSTGAAGASATMRAEFIAVQAGFALLPTMLGNGDLPIFVNSGATSLVTVSAASARTKLGLAIGTNVEAWDADLDAIAALAATAGMLSRTGAGAFAVRTMGAPAAGLTWTNGDGAAGAPTIALANDLAALEGLGSTGIAVRSAADTWVQRSVTGSGLISVANGDGVAGNPAITTTMNTARILGRTTAGTGVVEELTLTSPLTMSAGTVTFSNQTANTVFAGPSSGGATAPGFRALTGADGTGLVLIDRKVAANSATIDFTTGIDGTFDEYFVEITDLTPATDATNILTRVSEDAGVSFKAGATDYSINRRLSTDAGTLGTSGSTGTTDMSFAINLSNTKAFKATVKFSAPAGTARHKLFKFDYVYEGSGATLTGGQSDGLFKLDTNAINAIRFLMSAGNITQGNFALYGIRKT